MRERRSGVGESCMIYPLEDTGCRRAFPVHSPSFNETRQIHTVQSVASTGKDAILSASAVVGLATLGATYIEVNPRTLSGQAKFGGLLSKLEQNSLV